MRWGNANALLGQDVYKEWARSALPGRREDSLVLLVALDVLEVHVKEVRGIHWASFGVKLDRNNRAGLVNHAFDNIND